MTPATVYEQRDLERGAERETSNYEIIVLLSVELWERGIFSITEKKVSTAAPYSDN